jgi:chemotaxis protein histidine kinase CheA
LVLNSYFLRTTRAYFSVTLFPMPLGLWKSKWEIHREDMDRYREESQRRSAEHREEMERYREESERRSAEHREEMERDREESQRRSAKHEEQMERDRKESERKSAEHMERMERYRKESERKSAEHREQMERDREESERRSAVDREKLDQFSAEMREERAAAEGRWLQLGDETSELRKKYDRELAETRRFNREMLTQLDKTYSNLATALGMLGDEIIAMRGEIRELKGAVDAQTEAIMKLVDRFEDPEGRPPV